MMGAKRSHNLNLILLVVHELAELLPVPYLAKAIGILRHIIEEYEDNDDNEGLHEINAKLSEILNRTKTCNTDDIRRDIESDLHQYSGVLEVIHNDLAIQSLHLRIDSLLTILLTENIIIGRSCFLAKTGASYKLSSLFEQHWPQKYSNALIRVNADALIISFPLLRAFVTVDGHVPKHVEGEFRIPLESKAHFELLTRYGDRPVITGKTGQVSDIMLSGPLEIRVPGMRATKVEILENEKSREEDVPFVLILPKTTGEEAKNGRGVKSPM